MAKRRADELIVEQGLAPDAKTAQALILAGDALADEQRIEKAGTLLNESATLRLKSSRIKYVSRGGHKLEGALQRLELAVDGLVCLDLGASTGGFTDCLLQSGARRVYALDVGKGLLHWKLRSDSRVVVRDSVNVRFLKPDWIGEAIDLAVVDLAFISLRLVLPRLRTFEGSRVLALVKPQFEAERHEVEKGGMVPDPRLRGEILDRVREFARGLGYRTLGQAESTLRGRKGNQETFLLLEPSGGKND